MGRSPLALVPCKRVWPTESFINFKGPPIARVSLGNYRPNPYAMGYVIGAMNWGKVKVVIDISPFFAQIVGWHLCAN